jgi:hypothetical protein
VVVGVQFHAELKSKPFQRTGSPMVTPVRLCVQMPIAAEAREGNAKEFGGGDVSVVPIAPPSKMQHQNKKRTFLHPLKYD